MAHLDRRTFLAGTAATTMLASRARGSEKGANETVVLALMGANNRGSFLAERFAEQSGNRIAYVCDPDERAIGKGIEAAASQGGPNPQGVKDFRRALDDPAVDGLICAAPNHWHAAATLLACDAGKHVYVEKPCSHSAEEGERMMAQAAKTKRAVQVGTQRRSGPLYRHAVQRVHDGALGEALYAKSWYCRNRPSLGSGVESAPPAWLDYDLWQGPATEQPFRDNILHYNWHFFWHWGDAELGNNGIHTIDVCRWALDVNYPNRVTVAGSRLRYDDDQQTPDTSLAQFDCNGKTIVWEGVSWSPPYAPNGGVGIEIRGTEGTMILNDRGYTIYDNNRRAVEEFQDSRGDSEHVQNFLDAIRNGDSPNANIVESHKSTMFCHLGNISYRLGEPLEIDPKTGHIKNQSRADQLWSLEYRPGWMPTV